jgi:hypothetical protein
MSKIVVYRKALGVEANATLQELKTAYRSLMKEWHPDKFQDSEESKLNAEEKSKKIIAAYHFLVSIAPETRNETLAEYNVTIKDAGIEDYEYKSETLTITFQDGNVYEYFGVPKAVYVKLVNADSIGRFARRHIFSTYIYRSKSKLVAATA